HPSVPDEDEQFAAYRDVLEAAPNHTATIRTIDLGGDKNVPYFGHQGEANPFMGFRSIRLSSAYPEFFQTQLRAILRAARYGKPVTLCGEMAGRPRCIVPLLGMGLRRLSMSPAFVPPIKELLRHTTLPMAEEVARRVLAMHTVGEIRGYLTRKVREIWPNFNILDVRK